MTRKPFTPRNAAKYVVKTIVHGKVAQLTADALVDHTDLEEDTFVVNTTSFLIGWYISDKLKPLTDGAVDKTADFITEKREARKAKKETSKED